MALKSLMSILLLSSLNASAMASTMSIVVKGKPAFCLDLLGERTQKGTPIDVWECTAGLLGQQWFFDGGSWKIRSAVDPKKCIEAGSLETRGNPTLVLNDCNDTRTTQLFGWDIKTNAIYSAPDKGSLKPTGSMCMQSTTQIKRGDAIALAPCNAKIEEQQWTAVVGPPPTPPKTNVTFTFSPDGNTKMCLDLKHNGTQVDNGDLVVLSTCLGNAQRSQHWIFNEGSYKITSALNPNKCIDASSMAKGKNLMVWDCNGFPQQQWGYKVTPGKSTGTVYLTQASSGNSGCMATDSSGKFSVVGDCIQWHLNRVIAPPTPAAVAPSPDSETAQVAAPLNCKKSSYLFCCAVGKVCDCTKGVTAPGQCEQASYAFCCGIGTPCDCSQPPFMNILV